MRRFTSSPVVLLATALVIACLGLAAITPAKAFAADDGMSLFASDASSSVEVATWSELYDALQVDGNQIVLIADVTYGEGGGEHASNALQVAATANVELDLNGHIVDRGITTTSNNSVIQVLGTLTIKDSAPQAQHDPAVTYVNPIDEETVITVNGGILTGGHSSGGCTGINVNGGSFALEGGSICGNNSGGIYVIAGAFAMTGGSICGNTNGQAASGVGAHKGSTVVMSGGTICDNKDSGDKYSHGGGLYVTDGSSLTLSGGSIEGNVSGSGGGVHVIDQGSAFQMTDGKICGNVAKYNYGGGVCVANGSSFTMSGGEISGNSAPNGGGVAMDYNKIACSFTMSNDAAIKNNQATNGGGLRVVGAATLGDNAEISNNTATSGGGVYVGYGTFELSGNASVSGNTATQDGGGICGVQGGTSILAGNAVVQNNSAERDGGGISGGVSLTADASICGNNAGRYGGGLNAAAFSTNTISGGSIANNTAMGNGGGMYIPEDSHPTISGGTISGNQSTGDGTLGGGIYLVPKNKYNDLYMSGNPVVTGNTAAGKTSNAYVDTIGITGAMTKGANVSITSNSATSTTSPAFFTSGYYTYNPKDDPSNFFVGDAGYSAYLIETGSTYEVALLTEWQMLDRQLHAGGTVVLDRDYTALPVDTYLSVPANATTVLDLNGHVIDRALAEPVANGQVINVNKNGNLTIIDSAPEATHDPARSFIDPITNEAVIVNGGIITGGNNSNEGGGIVTSVDTPAMVISGGTIAGNRAKLGGGIYACGNGDAMTDGQICYNEATNATEGDGGGIHVERGTFAMSGGSIFGNKAATYGGGVSATKNTGWLSGGSFVINGGSITGNVAGIAGGGLGRYSTGGYYGIGGAAVVTGNKVAETENNAYLPNGVVLSVKSELTEGAAIGITTETAPVAGSPVLLTSSSTSSDYLLYHAGDDPRNYFFSDAGYAVATTANGVPALYVSRADVSITSGAHMTRVTTSGAESQTVFDGGDMDQITYQADEGFYFPQDYESLGTENGVSVARANANSILVSGAPTADTTLALADAVAIPNITVTGGVAKDADQNELTSALPGTEVTLVHDEPQIGWKFDKWQVKTGGVTVQNDTFAMGTEDVEVEAVFARIEVFAAFGTTKGGSFTVAGPSQQPDVPYDGGVNMTFYHGDEVTVVATPNTGYRFEGWYKGIVGEGGFVEGHTDTLVSAETTYAFEATGEDLLCAVFEPLRYSITVTGGHAEADGKVVTEAPYDSTVTLVAEPPTCKVLAGWTVTDGTAQIAPDETFVVCGEATIAAQWEDAHSWDAGKVTKAATTTSTGVKTYTCTTCKTTKTEVIPKLEEPTIQMGEDGTAYGPGATEEAVDQALTQKAKGESEPKGTVFYLLQAKASKVTQKSITLSWTKVKGAKKYVVYGNICGKATKRVKILTTTKTSSAFKKVNKKAVKKGTYYKFNVVALNKNGKVITTSKTIHIVTPGGACCNEKKVTTAASKTKNVVTLKKKKTFNLKAKAVKEDSKKKLKSHRGIQYESTNPKVAKVSAKGIITAVKKGTCYVYAYAQNGVTAKIKVTVTS